MRDPRRILDRGMIPLPPILHINETMGYTRRPDRVQFLKEL